MTTVYRQRVLEAATGTGDFGLKNLQESQDWLDEVINPPIAAEIELVFDSLRNKEPEYEPLLFDLYIGEAAAALDRCLRLRREIQELEAAAISFARQYARQEKTLPIDQLLDDRALQIDQVKKLQAGFADAAKQFKPSSSTPLSEGFALQSQAVSISHEDMAADYTRRNKLAAERWRILKDLYDAEKMQHRVPGHVLNFAERRKRLTFLGVTSVRHIGSVLP